MQLAERRLLRRRRRGRAGVFARVGGETSQWRGGSVSKVKLYVYPAEPGGMMARVAAWPGAHAVGASGEIAIEQALAILRADLSTLRERGAELPDMDLTDPIVEPTTNGYECPEDMAPLSAGDLILLLHRLDLSRERLLALI